MSSIRLASVAPSAQRPGASGLWRPETITDTQQSHLYMPLDNDRYCALQSCPVMRTAGGEQKPLWEAHEL